MKRLSQAAPASIRAAVWSYYDKHGRHDLPWRQPEPDGSFSPYKILVSELMLQQTQVARVIPKYDAFLWRFPTLKSVAAAEQGEVIRLWNGLGYNRRARYLRQTAQAVMADYSGAIPSDVDELVKLPGIGPNTAGAIAAYAFNQPAVFVETNIRTVYIHHFFADKTGVADKDIAAYIVQTLDTENSRQWYWALMDYGVYLKQTVGNLNKLSAAYAKQSPFTGSKREVRGAVVRALTAGDKTLPELELLVLSPLLPEVLSAMLAEGLIRRTKSVYHL